jgi:transposase
MQYDRSFKEEAVKLSDEIGVKAAASQLGIPYYTLADWRSARKKYGSNAMVGSGHKRMAVSEKDQRILELEKENNELKHANEILQEALGFFAVRRKK